MPWSWALVTFDSWLLGLQLLTSKRVLSQALSLQVMELLSAHGIIPNIVKATRDASMATPGVPSAMSCTGRLRKLGQDE